jgi:CubicO group peptidase (beta-lactamase class C family)
MAIAIVKDDKVIFAKGYGIRELGKNERVDENTLFAIASNSKAFTTRRWQF